MKKYKYEIIIFIVEIVFMTLELVASRILSPYFGNTNVVWTSVIGIILLSSSLGNFFGGIIADKYDSEKCLKLTLIFASLFILLIPFTSEYLLGKYSLLIDDIKIAAIISTIALFFIPSLLMGFINPVILKNKLNNLENAGKTSGKIYAISTIGGIVGTFLSGFYLIPAFGSMQILFGLSIVLFILSLFVHIKNDKKALIIVIVFIIIDLVLLVFYYQNNIVNLNKVLNGDMLVKASMDTQYNKVILSNSFYNDDSVRSLIVDGGYESATYLDKNKRNELVYKYAKFYDLMFDSETNIENILMIGGGGYSYPKYFISHFLDKKIDVVEIDEDITRIAKKYFYLDEVINEYNAQDRINLISEDGRTYLNRNNKKYDAILNDAFTGLIPPKTLTTKEAIIKIKKSLNDNGLYLTNVIGSLNGSNSKFLKSEVKTLKSIFHNVYVIPCDSYDENYFQNIMVIATDQDLVFEDNYILDIGDKDIILTDDYCPIDSLLPSN